MIMYVVYLLTNKVNGKMYVGQTSRPLEVRWQGHLGNARRKDSDMLVARAIRKHGPEAFERRVLITSNDPVGEKEKEFIKLLHTHVSEGGYNLTYGGDGGLPGYKFSDESKEKIRLKALGRKHNPETKAKMRAAAKNRIVSFETIEKRAAANTGKKRTEEQKARMKAGQLASGYRHSDETRKKISEASSRRVTSDETKLKLSKTSKGRRLSDYAKQQISIGNSKPVLQHNSLYELVDKFSSIKVAAQKTKVSTSTIQRGLIDNRLRGNFYWQYDVSSLPSVSGVSDRSVTSGNI